MSTEQRQFQVGEVVAFRSVGQDGRIFYGRIYPQGGNWNELLKCWEYAVDSHSGVFQRVSEASLRKVLMEEIQRMIGGGAETFVFSQQRVSQRRSWTNEEFTRRNAEARGIRIPTDAPHGDAIEQLEQQLIEDEKPRPFMLSECDRQMILLGLAELALSRPGWNYSIREICKKLSGVELFENLKSANADRVKSTHGGLRGERPELLSESEVEPVDLPTPK